MRGLLPKAKQFPLTIPLLFLLFVSAFFAFFLGDFLYLSALKEIGVSRSVPISSTYPLFVTVLAFIVYGRSISPLVVVGTVLIILAIKLISGEQNTGNVDTKGIIYAVSASACWSVSMVVLDYVVSFLPVEAVAGFRFMITCGLTVVVVSARKFTYTRNSLLWIGVGAAIVLIVSNYTFVEAIRLVSSAKVAPVSSSYPVISVLLATFFLKEKLSLRIGIGTALSSLGVFIVILG